eukprot:TRINITY_DN2056_c0_g3_i2.p1 TRINITY_DN2056_c0_g3~~TRINITY_DN2056_c0_g3_i2.p1  ORF type:complete len:145 (+),score=21.87 TRINITY_DN2056_c0_g3_i2:120-554(+)
MPTLEELFHKMSRDLVLQMLKRENQLRLSDEIQEQYDQQRKARIVPSCSIEEGIQRQVLSEFGFDPEDNLSIDVYRYSRARFPDDPEIKESILYIKYDRSRNTTLRIGDDSPNPLLVTLEGEKLPLFSFAKPKRPLVLLASSYS